MRVLEGKVAIVTGSARGIGRASAELLAAHGARVVVSDLDEDLARQTAAEIEGETLAVGGDLTKDGVCEALVRTAIDAFGVLDIVVNNAGYTWDGMAHKMSDEQFRAMLEIHTVVPFRVLVLLHRICATRRSSSRPRVARCSTGCPSGRPSSNESEIDSSSNGSGPPINRAHDLASCEALLTRLCSLEAHSRGTATLVPASPRGRGAAYAYVNRPIQAG